MNLCPVCADSSCRTRAEEDGALIHDCPRCGVYAMTPELADKVFFQVDSGAIDRSALSHYLRKLPRSGEHGVDIGGEEIEALRGRLRALTPKEQQDNLILWVGDNQPTPGQFVQSRKKPLSALIGCHVTAQGLAEPELDWLINQMKPLGLFDSYFGNQPSVVSLRLTLRGWEVYEDLRRRTQRSRQAFMPLPCGPQALDGVVDRCFRPIAAQAGFSLVAQNGVHPAGVADERLRGMIRSAPFILADLTDEDAGVLFAAGFAEGLGRPVIYTCEESRLAQKDGRSEARRAAAVPWQADNLEDAGRRLAAILRATFADRGGALH